VTYGCLVAASPDTAWLQRSVPQQLHLSGRRPANSTPQRWHSVILRSGMLCHIKWVFIWWSRPNCQIIVRCRCRSVVTSVNNAVVASQRLDLSRQFTTSDWHHPAASCVMQWTTINASLFTNAPDFLDVTIFALFCNVKFIYISFAVNSLCVFNPCPVPKHYMINHHMRIQHQLL